MDGDRGRWPLYEASATAFSINFLESLVFVPLLDNAEGGKKQTEDNRHHTINGSEDVVKSVVRKCSERSNATLRSILQRGGEFNGRAEATDGNAGVVGKCVTTTLEMILDSDASRFTRSKEADEEVSTLLQSEEPDECANDQDNNSIQDQDPIENNKTDSDMVALHDSTNGYGECDQQRYSQNHSGCEEVVCDYNVHKRVRSSPNNRQCKCQSASSKKQKVDERPSSH